ncbi:hypothetical protein H5410_013665 [Solanum commersonii]|uniref:Uncharacterized protein n=1 Tax=Solanum commersonii TaxID=4109 RepID=A0A9J5ZNV3_SOLCO|nr:hypothetical protein H5410_013665 [Solanum commersonii]
MGRSYHQGKVGPQPHREAHQQYDNLQRLPLAQLGKPNGQDALCMDQTRISQVVKSTLAENLGSSLEPYSFTELDTVTSQELGEDTTKSSEHGPSTMNHLQLTVLRKKNGPKYLTRLGPYHGLPEEAGLALVAVFFMVTLPFPVISEEDGESFTAFPVKEVEERAIVEVAIIEIK